MRKDFDNNCGYLYIVFGKSFLKEAALSLQSLRRYSNLPCHIITDIDDPSILSLFTSYDIVESMHKRSKVDFIATSPFNKTIYLDSDLLISMYIDDLFQLLDHYDCFSTHDAARKRLFIAEKLKEYDSIPYAFAEVNGGLFGFVDSLKSSVLKDWREIYYKYYTLTSGWDQPSLRIALWKSKPRIYILPSEYNVRSKNLIQKMKNYKLLNPQDAYHMKPRIYHQHYSSKIHEGEYPSITLEQLEEKIINNSYDILY